MKNGNLLKRASIARCTPRLYARHSHVFKNYLGNFLFDKYEKTIHRHYSTSSMHNEPKDNGEHFNKSKIEHKEKENGSSDKRNNSAEEENDLNKKETQNIKNNDENDSYKNCNKLDLINEIKKFKKDNDEKIIDNKILKEKYLSILAENENIRNRYIKEIENNKAYCIANFAKSLLDVADNLSLAIKNINEESLKQNDDIKTIYEGIQMTEVILHNIFNKYGINKYNPINEKFNPLYHEAIFEISDSTKEKGTIATVIQQGYKIKDRILRAAKVGVVKK